MTREEALEEGIRDAMTWGGRETGLEETAEFFRRYFDLCTPDLLEGFAVGLTMIAVEVAEIARQRREAAAATSNAPVLT